MGAIDYKEHIAILLADDIQSFIKNYKHDPYQLILKKPLFKTISNTNLALQIRLKNSAKKKLPTWYNTAKIIYHEKINLEQCSSETTAKYKAKLIGKGQSFLDLTAGMGVDTFEIGKNFTQSYFTEQHEFLASKTLHNLQQLGLKNINYMGNDAIDFLQNTNLNFDCIYIDPARRNETKKVFLLEECKPNIVINMPLLMAKTQHLWIKIAPVFDLSELFKKITLLTEVHLVAVKNELKEILLHLSPIPTENVKIIGVNLESTHPVWESKLQDDSTVNYASKLEKYLYEPNVTLTKSGGFNRIANQFDLKKLAKHSHLYTTEKFLTDFPGKIYEILAQPHSKELKKQYIHQKFNIISKNHPLSVCEIVKKYQLKEGGEKYLLATKINEKYSFIILSCVKY